MTNHIEQGTRRARRAWAAALKKHVKPGRTCFVEFRHDDWCAIYTSERLCNCIPHRVLKDDKGRLLARVEGAGCYDPVGEVEAFSGAAGGAT